MLAVQKPLWRLVSIIPARLGGTTIHRTTPACRLVLFYVLLRDTYGSLKNPLLCLQSPNYLPWNPTTFFSLTIYAISTCVSTTSSFV